PTETIDRESEMSEYGFDSIMLTELANRFNKLYQLELSPAVLYEHPTLKDFSNYLVEQHGAKFATQHPETMPERPEPPAMEPIPVLPTQGPVSAPPQPAVTTAIEREPIAVIGMAGRLPGSPDLESFWQHLEQGDDLISEIPPERWNWQDYYGDPTQDPNKTLVKWGGFVDQADRFDAMFFGISPKEARFMDPQQRIFMQTVWHTIEDAAIRPSDLAGSQTGLFVGVTYNDYYQVIKENVDTVEADISAGVANTMLANRISFRLDLHGPSESIDTACSSSLVAIHRAVNAIHQGDCDMAIAGGVNLILDPVVFLGLSKGGMLSLDGRCKTFDKRANGFARGEGVGAVMLKPLAKAIADDNPIHGVILGSAENHGGHAKSLTSPNPNAQAALIIKAWNRAGISPDSAGYIEAHGTGTPLGDPIEINGLKKAFGELYRQHQLAVPSRPSCAIGSAKTNIGHLEPAAGIAGLLKVLMMMRHQTLPKNAHLEAINPYISLEQSPFYLMQENQPWHPLIDARGQQSPRRAGVSAFGFGGSNAHLVIEEPPPMEMDRSKGPFIFMLSARKAERLDAAAQTLLTYLENGHADHYGLANIAWTLQSGREEMNERLAVAANSLEQLRTALRTHLQGKPVSGLFRGNPKKEQAQSKLLLDGDAGQAYIDVVLKSRDAAKLANLWVAGIDIDWTLLYPGGTPKRISLPGYSFDPKRFWVADAPAAGKPRTTDQ
ncbi:MAG: hypothetical protein GY731_17245, partial [Gammaproteobacteria bacterium]|nr:hypothetical protein [Gammaproteobacteria bacterium]